MNRNIVALGGWPADDRRLLDDFVLGLSGSDRPRVCFLPTASASAGAICWFEDGVTDSFGPQLAPLRDGLGFLPGSFCPHYDGEERRRPVYQGLVRDGFPPGWAADDGVALHFAGTELREIVSSLPAARAYRVQPDGEIPVEPRLLP